MSGKSWTSVWDVTRSAALNIAEALGDFCACLDAVVGPRVLAGVARLSVGGGVVGGYRLAARRRVLRGVTAAEDYLITGERGPCRWSG
ncbi:hypothetical protein GCM10009767_20830 [Kocuria aegyptia]|uniref:Uncharacterized protein n=1 Tax=Kocuria aegyptia TaxID=330943 RepID=A0ABN2KPC9_9MICC